MDEIKTEIPKKIEKRGRPKVYGENKKTLQEFRKEMIICKCGAHITRLNMSQHLRTAKHKAILSKNIENSKEIDLLDLQIREEMDKINELRKQRSKKTYVV